MSTSARDRQILEHLSALEELTVEEACRIFGIAPATVRRAFKRLAQSGKALKSWGGLKPLQPGGKENSADLSLTPTLSRLKEHLQAKRTIAERARREVRDGDVIFIDGGSTTFQLAPLLAERRVRIVTNSILIAHEMDRRRSTSEGAEVFLTGGYLYPCTGLAVGPEAVAAIRRYRANLAFLSVGGILPDGAYNNHHLVVEVERTMLQNAEKTFLLADSSKFGHPEMIHECGWDEIAGVITECELEDAKYARVPVLAED